MPKTAQTKGFTLVELMVVITIIAILSLIGIVTYSTFLNSARDSKRQSDLKSIQSALEQYYADQVYYPLSPNPGGSGSCPATGNGQLRVGCPLTNLNGAKTYIASVPQDPVTSNSQYRYIPLTTTCNNTTVMCTAYCLYANLNSTTGITNPAACLPLPSGYNFALTVP